MTQMWVLWWPKDGAASTSAGTGKNSAAVVSSDHSEGVSASPPNNCCGLGKFLVKLKRRSKMLMQRRRRITGRKIGASTQCHYDPHSYSLNFDDTASGNGNLVDQFHAFSSRYAATNPAAACRQRMQMATSH